jgi:hypothetical protein
MTTSGHAADDARTEQKGNPMDIVDITPTPEACHQIARLFRAQRADAEALAARATQALDNLDALDDDALEPWGRGLLAAAFEALYEDERARVRHMDEGLGALVPYADDGEGSTNVP